ncbi:MAG: ATP-binding protein [Desulfobacteraceae bacterium]|jgi:predicted HTH transcriptional regulator
MVSETARQERNFPLKLNTTSRALLSHLNLVDERHPKNAAILLFGLKPQSFFRPAEIKCMHCHSTEYQRPFASMQIYEGGLFEQADQAKDFVLSKINRAIGTRGQSNISPATYELPPDAVGEAIINAIAHRDYYSNASVEVRLFSDRLEVWNPGKLPGTITIDDLFTDHPSIPNNPLIAESLYLTGYIEKAGSGTQKMIKLCKDAGLPEPEFRQQSGSFVLTLWRDWLTDEVINTLNINDRQVNALKLLKIERKLTTMEYQKFVGCSRRTAARDLDELLGKGVIIRKGAGRGAHYIINRAINVPIVP